MTKKNLHCVFEQVIRTFFKRFSFTEAEVFRSVLVFVRSFMWSSDTELWKFIRDSRRRTWTPGSVRSIIGTKFRKSEFLNRRSYILVYIFRNFCTVSPLFSRS